jgi:hypothetical protein
MLNYFLRPTAQKSVVALPGGNKFKNSKKRLILIRLKYRLILLQIHEIWWRGEGGMSG